MGNGKLDLKKIILIAVTVTISSFVARYAFDEVGKMSAMFDKHLVTAASQINQNLPIMVDSETQFDVVIPLPRKKIQYVYTLINYSIDDIDVEELANAVEPDLLNNIRTNSALADFRNNKVTMIYCYKDKDGKELFTKEYTYDDYKK
ncbi:hypothetical protein FACS1894127_1170 [Clostridia bacterium]|nr:hypothetical protein FACS1894127_1170 [Clostridia bacterium]